MCNPNTVTYALDDEHRKVTLTPGQSAIVSNLNLVYYAPNVVMPCHAHSTAQFSTLLTGHSAQNCRRSAADLRHGVSEFKPIDFEHSNQIGPFGAVMLSINLHSDHDSFRSEFGSPDWKLSSVSHSDLLWRELQHLLFHPSDSVRVDLEELVLSLLTNEMSSESKTSTPPAWIQQAEQGLHEPHWDIEQIAQNVGVHRVHLCRVFRACFGLSVSAYRQRIAAQKGLACLLSGRHTIADASLDAGFADQSHFTRVIKQHFGLTPNKLKSLFS